MMTISDRITKIRELTGKSQAELGSLIKRTAGCICNYEKGRRPIRARDLEILMAILSPEQKEQLNKEAS